MKNKHPEDFPGPPLTPADELDLFDQIDTGLILLRDNGLILESNRTASNLLGMDRQAVLHKKLLQFIHAEDQPLYLQHFKLFIETDERQICQLRIVKGEAKKDVTWAKFVASAVNYPSKSSKTAENRLIRMTLSEIYEPQLVNETLRETNTMLENLLNYANAPIIVWDPQFHITRFNHAFETLTGYSERQVLGQSLEILFPREQRAASMEWIHRASSGEHWDTVEIPILHRDGSVRTVQWNSSTVVAQDGKNPIATIAQGQDITERKQTAEALIRSEALLRTIQRLTHIGGWEWTTSNQTMIWTEEMLRLHEFEACNLMSVEPEIITKSLECYQPAHRVAVGLAFDGCIYHGQAYDLEFPFITAKGRAMWVRTSAEPVWENGKVVRVIGFLMDITERKRAEEALRQSEAKLKILFELMPVGVSVLDKAGMVAYVNPAMETILGITQAALLRGDYRNRTYLRHDGTPMPVEDFASMRAAREKRAVYNVETGVVKEDGQVVWTNVSAVPVVFPDWSIIIATTDITVRKHAEEKVAQLAAIVESSDDIIISKTLEGVITSWNKGAQQIYGYSEQEMLGKPISILVPPERSDEMPLIFEKIRTGKHVEHFETVRLKNNGERIHVSLAISPIINMQGEIVSASTIGRDITERKQVEDHLRQLSGAVEKSPISIIITDINGRIEYINPKCSSLTGYGIDETRGRIPRILKSPDSPPELWATLMAGKEWHGEFLAHKKGGSPYWNYSSISAITDAEGQITHLVSMNEDISERKSSEEKIRLLNIELEQLALTDYLTNLYNRRYFMLRGTEEFKRACRTNEPLALLMVDLDGFKTVNDTYGHEAGDLVLQKVSAVMKSSLREFDILSRMGGDEFNVLLPNTSPEDAHHLAERLRWKMANTAFTPADSFLNITISIGAAMLSNEMASIDDLLRNADAALYRAKNNGKNCLVFY